MDGSKSMVEFVEVRVWRTRAEEDILDEEEKEARAVVIVRLPAAQFTAELMQAAFDTWHTFFPESTEIDERRRKES